MVEAGNSRDDTRSRIVAVAARLLRDEGPAAVTTRGVAEGAGVQAPTIYRLFGDKDGLLDAVAEHVMATYVADKSAVVEAASRAEVDPLDDLRSGWHTQIDFGVANPDVFRLLNDPSRVAHSPAAASGRRILEARVHRVALTGRLRVSEHRAINIIQAAGIGTIQTLLMTAPEQRDPHLANIMFTAALGQILTDAPEWAEDGATAAVVAFRAIAPRLSTLSDGERQLLVEWLDRAIDSG